MQYFLLKTDPDTYSLSDLQKDHETVWDGVHNAQALIFIRKMHKDDIALIYHSGKEKAIVGSAQIVSEPKENKKDTRKSFVVDIRFIKKFDVPVSLKEIKDTKQFDDWSLIRQSRLSVMQVPSSVIHFLEKKEALI